MNKVPGFDTLTEDGVYGEKTSNSYNLLINELLHGSFPILTYVDPLQSVYTGIHVNPKTTKQEQIFPKYFRMAHHGPYLEQTNILLAEEVLSLTLMLRLKRERLHGKNLWQML